MYRRSSAPRVYGRSYVRGQGSYRVVAAARRAPARRAPARRVARKPRMTGQGAYKYFDAPALGQGLGGTAGAVIGNMVAPGIGGSVGAKLGGYVGKALGQGFRAITGFGEYTVNENSLLYPDRVVPSFGDDSIRVRKREYIADIDASTAFTNNFFAVNPGLNDTFPWLSSIANNYEQYRWNGLVFQFVSTSSDAIASSTNLSMGQVVLATDYNAADHAYLDFPQMMGSMFANSGKCSENIMHAVECAPTDQTQKLFYIRSGDVPTGTDIRLYDMCSFQLATQKMQSVYTGMGQLWVSYDVTLCKSVQNNQLGFDLNTDKYVLVAPAVTTAYFGTSRTLAEHSNLGTTVTGTVITMPPTVSSGYYMLLYQAVGAATAVVVPTVTLANCTNITAWVNNTQASLSNSATTSAALIMCRIIRIDSRDATITFSAGTLPTSPTYGDLIITQVNGELYADL